MIKRLTLFAFISIFTLLNLQIPTVKAEASRNCQDVAIAVGITDSAPKNQTVNATYCTPTGSLPQSTPIDVLVAGATYNRTYWDWPQNPDLYSYVNKTLSAGRATLAFDRLGTGKSSRLPGGGLTQTVQVDASVLRQLVSWVQEKGHKTVNAVGHSLGSIVVTKEAASYKDLDAIVLTGILHLPAISTTATNFATSLYPATLDPAFKDAKLDATYLTTIPGKRGPAFYDPATADPTVIAYDEAHKDLATSGELTSSLLELETPALLNTTKNITARVFAVMGATDAIFCSLTVDCSSARGIAANEKHYYPSAASFSSASIPHTGHNLTLHPSATDSFSTINAWLIKNS